MRQGTSLSLVMLGACAVPDVVGTWDADERNAYTLLRNGGVSNDIVDVYPIVDPDTGNGEQLEVTFRRDATVEFATVIVDLATDPQTELFREVTSYEFVGRGPVTLDIVGSFDGDDFECNLAAGPDTLTCNLTTNIEGGVDVVSYRLWRRDATGAP